MTNIGVLKQDFDYIRNMRSDACNIFDNLETKIGILSKIYIGLIKTHEDANYIFGLDSFHFQNKLIELEYENMKNIFASIDNRMYCEYYKLHVMIQKYINDDITEPKVIEKTHSKKKYPIYKDLETHIVYDFKQTLEIQSGILQTIQELQNYLMDKETELKEDTEQSDMGLNIDNIVNSQLYSNAILREKIDMFIRYMKAFHLHHKKYFSRLIIKSKLMAEIIDEDICTKQFSSPNKNGNESSESEHEEISIEDVGRRVNVKGYASDGTLRFYGKHNTNNDMRCGVEFDDAVGKNNGIVGGHQYFNCESGHGILCVSYKVTFIEETIKLIVDDNSHT